MKKLIVYLFLLTLTISCRNGNRVEIYFYEQQEFNTIIALDKESFKKQAGLRRLRIFNEKLKKQFLTIIDNDSIFDTNFSPDIRYVLVSENDTIYYGYNGNYCTSKFQKGKVNYIIEIEKVIQNNFQKSIPVTDPIPKLPLSDKNKEKHNNE